MENQKYMIKFYKKELIEEYIINKLNIKETAKSNFFESLKETFNESKNDENLKSNGTIQQIIDINIDDKGLWVVTEFLETHLIEYLETVRNDGHGKCKELKYRNIVIPLLDLLNGLDNKISFAGLLNSFDIYVNDNKKPNESFIKITHPFFNKLETVFKILDNEQYQNFYPPEFICFFKQLENGKIILDCKDLSEPFSSINHNFDMWALGYLLYEILYESRPYNFTSLEKAKTRFSQKNIFYKIKRSKYSIFITDVITSCLKYENRLNMKNIKLDIYKESISDEKNFEKLILADDKKDENLEEDISMF